MDAPLITQIVLPAALDHAMQQLLLKYARLPRSLTRTEWPQALAAFDLLHTGQVILGNEALTFQSFYLRYVDAVHATSFIEQLLLATDPEAEGERLAQEVGRQVLAALAAREIGAGSVPGRALMVYCIYWWRSFSKGYVREATVFRDLEQTDIAFEAHDLRDPIQRRSAHDLKVSGRTSDVKTSTYFLHTARSFPLRSDFYVVRLWDDQTSRWLDLVLLKPEVWQELDGEPEVCEWDRLALVLPAVAQVTVRGETLVVVPYAEWKSRIQRKQLEEGAGAS